MFWGFLLRREAAYSEAESNDLIFHSGMVRLLVGSTPNAAYLSFRSSSFVVAPSCDGDAGFFGGLAADPIVPREGTIISLTSRRRSGKSSGRRLLTLPCNSPEMRAEDTP